MLKSPSLESDRQHRKQTCPVRWESLDDHDCRPTPLSPQTDQVKLSAVSPSVSPPFPPCVSGLQVGTEKCYICQSTHHTREKPEGVQQLPGWTASAPDRASRAARRNARDRNHTIGSQRGVRAATGSHSQIPDLEANRTKGRDRPTCTIPHLVPHAVSSALGRHAGKDKPRRQPGDSYRPITSWANLLPVRSGCVYVASRGRLDQLSTTAGGGRRVVGETESARGGAGDCAKGGTCGRYIW
jgi:hypothetical protein